MGSFAPSRSACRGMSSGVLERLRAEHSAGSCCVLLCSHCFPYLEFAMNHRSLRHPSLKSLATLSAWALLLTLPCSLLGQNKGSLYSTQFEQPVFVADVPLVVQDGWVGVPPLSPLAAIVSTAKP